MTGNIIRHLQHRRILLFWLVALLGILSPWLSSLWRYTPVLACTVASVHDGDTLRARCSGAIKKVRFHCIDAPEMQQAPWGRESRDVLRSRIAQGAPIEITQHDTDRYGRIVGEVRTADGEDLNLWMVQSGQAAVYPRYCHDERFYQAQAIAQRNQVGIWRTPGTQQRPWDYRKSRR